jgi:hypothetical protein
MYMMVRKKLSEITDLQILQFLKTNQKRDAFLEEHGLEFHEREEVFGLGFWLRDRIRDFLALSPMADGEKAVPLVLMMHKMAFPASTADGKHAKLTEWLEANNSKIFLATSVYFLIHFEGHVQSKQIYTY